VWRTVRCLGVNQEDVPDVCQEVFLVVHRKLAQFEGRSKLKTWLFSICLRRAASYRRGKARRREEPMETFPVVEVAPDQAEALDARRARDLLYEALDQLDDRKREVFVLYEIEHLSMVEVAETVGCPVRTAYSRLRAARSEVKRHFKRSQTLRSSKS
jgi:RNA polymerase sigma-70 factor (ECF subfamily)